MTVVEFVEFVPDRIDAVVEVMAELAGGSGWLTFDPAVPAEFEPRMPSMFGRLVSGRGPAVPRATWVPAQLDRRRPDPVSVGIQHGTGPDAASRLADKDLAVPERWRVASDHAKRGLVIYVPIDVAHVDVVTWTLAAAAGLTRIPLSGAWRMAIHRT